MLEGKFLADTFQNDKPPQSAPDGVMWRDGMGPIRIGDQAIDIDGRHWIWLPDGLKEVALVEETPPAVQVAYQPPVMYDVTTDSYRAVTQADWDRAQHLLRSLCEFHRAVVAADRALPTQESAL